MRPKLRRALAPLFLTLAVLGGIAQLRPARAAESTPERALMQAQVDLPIAYLLSKGAMEATLGFDVANKNFDPFGVDNRSLEGALAPSTANAGFPRGVAGRAFRFTIGTARSINLYADVGRGKYDFSIAGIKLDHQIYGMRWNVAPERGNIPAFTLEYAYQLRQGPLGLETDGHRMVLHVSKGFGGHILAHASLGGHKDDVTAEFPNGPIPQIATFLPAFSYPQGVFESAIGMTWLSGRRTDISAHVENKTFDRGLDMVIPGGGLDSNTRALLHLSHAFAPSIVLGVRLERHSHSLLALHPQLYNPRSVGSFQEPFGWMGFHFTWRGDLGLQ